MSTSQKTDQISKTALTIEAGDMHGKITLEVASHLGLDRVRTISMNETAGLARGE